MRLSTFVREHAKQSEPLDIMANVRGRPRKSTENSPRSSSTALGKSLAIGRTEDELAALEEQLTVAARLRVKAEKDRSYVAARGFAVDERALQDKIRAYRSEHKRAAADADDALELALVEALREMPMQQRDAVLARFVVTH